MTVGERIRDKMVMQNFWYRITILDLTEHYPLTQSKVTSIHYEILAVGEEIVLCEIMVMRYF